jgi:hypothetical protein
MRILIRCAALLALIPAWAHAAPRLDCPSEPAALSKAPPAVRDSIRASAAQIGHVATRELESRLRARYPQIAAAVLEQALHAAYCQRLRAQPQLSDEQRVARFSALHTVAELDPVTPLDSPATALQPPVPYAVAAKTLLAPAGGTDVKGHGGGTGTRDLAVPEPLAQIPQFPWPPPPPSAARIIPAGILTARMRELESHSGRTLAVNGRYHLRDVDAVLRRSLRAAGYEFRYYAVPRGFAIAARLERTDDQGDPYPQPARFDTTFRPLEHFTLTGYLQALFLAPPGHYRVIAFILSPEPFRASGRPVSSQEAGAWLEGGVNVLPREIGDLEYTLPDYACTALVYEFDKRDTQTNPVELHPGRLSADIHLERSGIAKLLWNPVYP